MKRKVGFLFLVAFLILFSGCSFNKEPKIIENEAVLGQISGESSSNDSEMSKSDIEISSEISSSVSESSSQSLSKDTSSSSSSSSLSENSSSSSSSLSSTFSESSTSSSMEESLSESDDVSYENGNVSQKETRAVWISYLEYQSVLQGKSKSQFTNNIKSVFFNIANDGFNTVYVHVRSHSDAMYSSDIFPWSIYCTGTEGVDPGYDPLEIMVEEAHALGLKIEAWINPYRIKGTSNTSKISKSSPAYKWLNSEKVVVLDSGIYYNPADEDVINLIVFGVEEIVENYDIDGIHFDDYFYPTTAESFDKSYYNDYKSNGGKLKLADWRRQNVNTLIKKVYSAIKAIDSSCKFGVSPAGNMDQNYNALYCDVYTWVTSKGYVDYICPQIYFGFNHKSKPYLDVLSTFNDMITETDVELIVGLAAYKIGNEDSYAGESGKKEWINGNDIIARQITAARQENRYSGFALYRYDSLYNPTSGMKSYVKTEMRNILEVI